MRIINTHIIINDTIGDAMARVERLQSRMNVRDEHLDELEKSFPSTTSCDCTKRIDGLERRLTSLISSLQQELNQLDIRPTAPETPADHLSPLLDEILFRVPRETDDMFAMRLDDKASALRKFIGASMDAFAGAANRAASSMTRRFEFIEDAIQELSGCLQQAHASITQQSSSSKHDACPSGCNGARRKTADVGVQTCPPYPDPISLHEEFSLLAQHTASEPYAEAGDDTSLYDASNLARLITVFEHDVDLMYHRERITTFLLCECKESQEQSDKHRNRRNSKHDRRLNHQAGRYVKSSPTHSHSDVTVHEPTPTVSHQPVIVKQSIANRSGTWIMTSTDKTTIQRTKITTSTNDHQRSGQRQKQHERSNGKHIAKTWIKGNHRLSTKQVEPISIDDSAAPSRPPIFVPAQPQRRSLWAADPTPVIEAASNVRLRPGMVSSTQHGQRNSQRGPAHGAAQRKWIYVANLKNTTNADDLIAYVAAKIECQDVVAKHLHRSGTDLSTLSSVKFKIGVPEKFFSVTLSPSFWPSHAIVKEFTDSTSFFRQQLTTHKGAERPKKRHETPHLLRQHFVRKRH